MAQLESLGETLFEVRLNAVAVPGLVSAQTNNDGTRLIFRPATEVKETLGDSQSLEWMAKLVHEVTPRGVESVVEFYGNQVAIVDQGDELSAFVSAL